MMLNAIQITTIAPTIFRTFPMTLSEFDWLISRTRWFAVTPECPKRRRRTSGFDPEPVFGVTPEERSSGNAGEPLGLLLLRPEPREHRSDDHADDQNGQQPD